MEKKDIEEVADLFAEVFHNLVSQELYENGKRRPVYHRIWRARPDADETQEEVDSEGGTCAGQLSFSDLAKVASYLDHRTLFGFRQISRKFRIAASFGAAEAYSHC